MKDAVIVVIMTTISKKPVWSYISGFSPPPIISFYFTTGFTGTTSSKPDEVDVITSATITPTKQTKVTRGNEEGYECISCSEFSPMAELNMPEGETEPYSFKCYSCRKGLR